jgi:hypothetical protein
MRERSSKSDLGSTGRGGGNVHSQQSSFDRSSTLLLASSLSKESAVLETAESVAEADMISINSGCYAVREGSPSTDGSSQSVNKAEDGGDGASVHSGIFDYFLMTDQNKIKAVKFDYHDIQPTAEEVKFTKVLLCRRKHLLDSSDDDEVDNDDDSAYSEEETTNKKKKANSKGKSAAFNKSIPKYR